MKAGGRQIVRFHRVNDWMVYLNAGKNGLGQTTFRRYFENMVCP
ncbi:hypothetical protein ATI02_1501 [Pseudomonas baetica]|uniref:Uncharacterized protein n=1 Tax=Pseudomonas baetica TaxID=674054 RepID=A0ABX4PX04_9PSED|nr:hypothetical protein ATI02_1501 [Pseudomonas baetica]